MHCDYEYRYGDHVSYPQRSSAANQSTRLVSDGLRRLCEETRDNMARLRERLVKADHCYGGDPKYWHGVTTATPTRCGVLQPDTQTPASWENTQAMFGTDVYIRPKTSTAVSRGVTVIRPCSMCTTLSEHQQHIARRGVRMKAKEKVKHRPVFIAPPPVVKKQVAEVTEKCEILYRVTIKTGRQLDAATSANVWVTLHGRKRSTLKKRMCKKLTGHFCFGRGTSEVFYLKGPVLGELRGLTVEHDGKEKKHGWFLEEIHVLNMASGQLAVCVCKDWLSLYTGLSLSIKRDIAAEQRHVAEKEYNVQVYTADVKMAGTDSNVFVTFYGSRGVSRKLALKNKSKNNFERGQVDSFDLTISDIGKISKIRLEHDNSGFGPGWLLEKVSVEDTDSGPLKTFPCGEWLEKDRGDGEIFRDLYPLAINKQRSKDVDRHSSRKDEDGLLDYEVSVSTGSVSFAGTDANVYLRLVGRAGRSGEVALTNRARNNFEKGQTDVFKVRADDVGPLTQVCVRHDNSGMAAGWYLEQVTIKRFFSRTEVVHRLQKMQDDFDSRVASEIGQDDAELTSRRRPLEFVSSSSQRTVSKKRTAFSQKEKPNYYSDRSNSDSDDDKIVRKSRGRHMTTAGGRDASSDSSEEAQQLYRKWQQSRLPFCDEYVFVCKRWLADNEDDKQISRELKPTSVTTFYKNSK